MLDGPIPATKKKKKKKATNLDPTFSGGGNGWLTLDSLGLARQDQAMSVTVQADHKPVVAGYANVATGNFDAVAVRFTLMGALD